MPAAGRLAACLLALAVMLALPGAARAGAGPPASRDAPGFERCFARIALFDEIIITPFDYRLLAIERWELEEARFLRDRAQANCAIGQLWFGLNDIERALILIGVPPSFGEGETPDGPGRGASDAEPGEPGRAR